MGEFHTIAFRFILITLVFAICVPMPSNIIGELPFNSQAASCRRLKRLREEDGSCGKCMEWYTSENPTGNDQCIPVGNITVPMGERNAFLPNGSTINLECKFDTNVTCSWKRRESNICIDHKYRYIGLGNGTNTRDCSLQIINFEDFDTGHWICRSYATSHSDARIGTQVYLSNEMITTAKNNTSANMELNDSIVLQCYNDDTVNCVWHRKNAFVEITERYSYIAKNKSGCGTRDCSIKIEKLEDIDMGSWRCESTANSTTNATGSTIVHLRKVSDLKPSTTKSQVPDLKLSTTKPQDNSSKSMRNTGTVAALIITGIVSMATWFAL